MPDIRNTLAVLLGSTVYALLWWVMEGLDVPVMYRVLALVLTVPVWLWCCWDQEWCKRIRCRLTWTGVALFILPAALVVASLFAARFYGKPEYCESFNETEAQTESRAFYRIQSALGIALQKLYEYEEQVRRVMLDQSLGPEDLDTDRLDRIIKELEQEAHKSRYFGSISLTPGPRAYDPKNYDGYGSSDQIRPTAEDDPDLHQRKFDRNQRELYRIMLTHENFAEMGMELEDVTQMLANCHKDG